MLLPTTYLGPISWWQALTQAPSVRISTAEHYVKQTTRNRCRILMPDGPQDLVVPVCAAPNHTPVRDIRISDHGQWRHHHWSALRTAYGKSPFYEYYADDFAPFYERRYDFLIDFNEGLRRLVAELLDVDTPVSLATTFEPLSPLPQPDVRPYYQVFAQRLGFQADLSIADLLFNLGPEGLLYLTNSQK